MKPALSRVAVLRAMGFFVFWIIITGSRPADIAAGAVAALVSAWASLRLLPPGPSRVRPSGLARLVLRFLCRSVVGGVDVARRAFDPQLPLQTGFVVYPVSLPRGPARNMFTTLMSLLPGTLPADATEKGGLLVHCLDVEQPVTAELAKEEAVFTAVIGKSRGDE